MTCYLRSSRELKVYFEEYWGKVWLCLCRRPAPHPPDFRQDAPGLPNTASHWERPSQVSGTVFTASLKPPIHHCSPSPVTLPKDSSLCRCGGKTVLACAHCPRTLPGTMPGTFTFPRIYKVVTVITRFTESISDDISKVSWLSKGRTQSPLAQSPCYPLRQWPCPPPSTLGWDGYIKDYTTTFIIPCYSHTLLCACNVR